MQTCAYSLSHPIRVDCTSFTALGPSAMGGKLPLSMLSREEIIASDPLKPLIFLSSILWQTPPQGTSQFISFLFSCGFSSNALSLFPSHLWPFFLSLAGPSFFSLAYSFQGLTQTFPPLSLWRFLTLRSKTDHLRV